MKKILFIILIFIFILGFSSRTAAEFSEMEMMAENAHLQLYMNPSTTEIAVIDKHSKDKWFSNPQNIEEMETKASENIKEMLQSQIEMTVHTPSSVSRNSNSHSVKYNQFDITKENNGVRVDYTVGEKWSDGDYLPDLMDEETFQEMFLDKLDEENRSDFEDNYKAITVYELEEEKEEEEFSISGVDEENVFGNYRAKAVDDDISSRDEADLIYLFLQRVVSYLDQDKYESVNDLNPENISAFENETMYVREEIFAFDTEELINHSRNIGNKPDQFAKMFYDYMLEPPTKNIDIFHVPVIYRLDGNELVVKIPGDEVSYPRDIDDEKINREFYPISHMKVLPYFGAANKEDEGFIFVPDGSGALIEFNNNRLNADAYSERMYGWDYGKFRRSRTNNPRDNRIPVYGMKKGDSAFLAIIEDGQALSRIEADIAGRTNSYNTVSPQFLLRDYENMTLGEMGEGEIQVFQKEPYQGDLQIRYGFISEKELDYVDMAHYYQDYLKDKYNISSKKQIDNNPFYLELVGAISRTESVYGLPMDVEIPLTTYKQGEKIVQELINNDIKNLHVRYLGWLDGGIKHYYPEEINLEEKVGNKDDFTAFSSFSKENEVQFYPHVDFLSVHRDRIFDNFSPRQDASQTIDRSISRKYYYHPGTFAVDVNKYSYVLSPSGIQEVIQNFLNNGPQNKLNNISVDLGSYVNSDFSDDINNFTDRQQSLEKSSKELNYINNQNKNILIDNGNSYALEYADDILYTPPTSTEYNIVDESVPFFQIALSGIYNYSLEPVNLADEERENLLRTLETGASLHFKLFYEENEEISKTEFDYLYSANFSNWKEKIISIYNEIGSVLNEINNQKIIEHKKIQNKVYKTTYEAGKSIIVNYNDYSVQVDGVEVEKLDFMLLEEGDKE